jgi:hypothetical protein
MKELLIARIKKIKTLLEQYNHESALTQTTPQRQIRVKSYLHCFQDELRFLESLNIETEEESSDYGDDDDDRF